MTAWQRRSCSLVAPRRGHIYRMARRAGPGGRGRWARPAAAGGTVTVIAAPTPAPARPGRRRGLVWCRGASAGSIPVANSRRLGYRRSRQRHGAADTLLRWRRARGVPLGRTGRRAMRPCSAIWPGDKWPPGRRGRTTTWATMGRRGTAASPVARAAGAPGGQASRQGRALHREQRVATRGAEVWRLRERHTPLTSSPRRTPRTERRAGGCEGGAPGGRGELAQCTAVLTRA